MNWFVTSALLAGLVAFGRPRRLRSSEPGGSAECHVVDDGPSVVVVVPARDEEATLPRLVGSLLDREVLRPRIIVVDDHSSDATFECIEALGVEGIRAPDLPSGWQGKPWALHQGVARLAAEPDETVVVFLDADVWAEPGALASLVEERRRLDGVVSVQPHHHVPTTVEQLSAFFNIVSIMGIGAGTARPHGLFGPVLCTTLGDLRAVGGHAAVRGEVAEDLALAERFRSHGIPTRVLVGGAFGFRMYEEGWTALREGWSKNIASGARATPPWRTVLVGWWITGLLVAAADLLRAATSPSTVWPEVLTYLVAVLTVGVLLRRVGTYRVVTALLYPAALLGFVGIFGYSLWCTHVRRSVRWKGRSFAPSIEPPAALAPEEP